jgi:hypothetical protein
MFEVIGQLLGIAAVVFGFISYQMKTSRGILIFQLTTALIFSAHYFLIGALTAMALNLLGAISCVFYFFRDKRGGKSIIEPIVFIALIMVASILTWEGWYSAFIMSGLVVNSISLVLSNAQKTRLCMFLKSPLCLIYNIIVSSGGGIVYECVVLVSSLIGIIKNRSSKVTDETGDDSCFG